MSEQKKSKMSPTSYILKDGLLDLFKDEYKDKVDETLLAKEIEAKIVNLPIINLKANPYQPRKIFNEDYLKELSESIKEHGVLEPILVSRNHEEKDSYYIVAGERRWRASQLANKQTIPAIIKDFNDKKLIEVAILENLQREDLTQLEIAEAFAQMINLLKYTQAEISQKVGKSREYVTNTLRLLRLPERILQLLSNKEISAGHARSLLSLEKSTDQEKVAALIIEKELSVRDTESLIRNIKKRQADGQVAKPVPIDTQIYQKQINQKYQNLNISVKNGFIKIPYKDEKSLQELVNKFFD